MWMLHDISLLVQRTRINQALLMLLLSLVGTAASFEMYCFIEK
jgi:hypothetical protein